MKKLLAISKTLNVLIIICFLLPFVVIDCSDNTNEVSTNSETSLTEENPGEKDSLSVSSQDTLEKDPNDSITIIKDEATEESVETVEKDESSFWRKLFKLITEPEEETYTLFGFICAFWLFLIFGIVAFIYLFALYLQFFPKTHSHMLVIISFSFILLMIELLYFQLKDLKVGFFVIFGLNFLMIIIELLIKRKQRLKTS